MVKIKCILRGDPSRPTVKRPYVASSIRIPGYTSKPVLFLIDTGSEMSFLSPTDAESIGIILDDLPSPPPFLQMCGVGGLIPNYQLGFIKEYYTKFVSNNGLFEVPGENLVVLKQDNGYKLPSVLGVDFLSKYGFTLSLDHGRSVVELGN